MYLEKKLDDRRSDFDCNFLITSGILSVICTRFEHMIYVIHFHNSIFHKWIDFFDGHDLGQLIAEPLRIEKVKFTKCCVVVVQ